MRVIQRSAGSLTCASAETTKYLFGSPGRAVRVQPECPGVSSRQRFGGFTAIALIRGLPHACVCRAPCRASVYGTRPAAVHWRPFGEALWGGPLVAPVWWTPSGGARLRDRVRGSRELSRERGPWHAF